MMMMIMIFDIVLIVGYLICITKTVINVGGIQVDGEYTNNDESEFPSSVLFEPCCGGGSTTTTTTNSNTELSSLLCSSYPNQFPKPTRMIRTTTTTTSDDDIIIPILQPTYGYHRSYIDNVIFAYAEGYTLPYYMMFIESLKETGYTGDVVLAIADTTIIKPNVLEYLQTYTLKTPPINVKTHTTTTNNNNNNNNEQFNVILYQVSLVCTEQDGTTGRHVTKRGEMDVFEMCHFNDHVYGTIVTDESNNNKKIIQTTYPDPREGRVVATIRYEYYWIWSLQYTSSTWIMLLDARDAYFQSNPFVQLPRYDNDKEGSMIQKDGYLYFFGENTIATRIGRSTKNLKWIRNGYGDNILDILKDKPTICSGSTMGEQIAIETYLRAMINEHDESTVKMAGSDQGFHNYLYYSGKLHSATTIKQIIVWEQGYGIINNLGALRIKSLSDWGIIRHNTDTELSSTTTNLKYMIYQWDNRTISPVVHQYDRDNQLHKYIVKQRFKEYMKLWEEMKH